MRFQVPQFTEVEDQVIGPLTFKQFIYLAGAAGLGLILYSFLPLFWAVIVAAPIAALAAALAFLKVNNRPFIQILEAAFKFLLSSRLYIWKHQANVPKIKELETEQKEPSFMPKLSSSNLKDLSWKLDVKGNLLEPEITEEKMVK